MLPAGRSCWNASTSEADLAGELELDRRSGSSGRPRGAAASRAARSSQYCRDVSRPGRRPPAAAAAAARPAPRGPRRAARSRFGRGGRRARGTAVGTAVGGAAAGEGGGRGSRSSAPRRRSSREEPAATAAAVAASGALAAASPEEQHQADRDGGAGEDPEERRDGSLLGTLRRPRCPSPGRGAGRGAARPAAAASAASKSPSGGASSAPSVLRGRPDSEVRLDLGARSCRRCRRRARRRFRPTESRPPSPARLRARCGPLGVRGGSFGLVDLGGWSRPHPPGAPSRSNSSVGDALVDLRVDRLVRARQRRFSAASASVSGSGRHRRPPRGARAGTPPRRTPGERGRASRARRAASRRRTPRRAPRSRSRRRVARAVDQADDRLGVRRQPEGRELRVEAAARARAARRRRRGSGGRGCGRASAGRARGSVAGSAGATSPRLARPSLREEPVLALEPRRAGPRGSRPRGSSRPTATRAASGRPAWSASSARSAPSGAARRSSVARVELAGPHQDRRGLEARVRGRRSRRSRRPTSSKPAVAPERENCSEPLALSRQSADEAGEQVDAADVAFVLESRSHALAAPPRRPRYSATARAVAGPTAASISRGSAPVQSLDRAEPAQEQRARAPVRLPESPSGPSAASACRAAARWRVIANRWASSRTRWTSWSAGSLRDSRIGSGRPGTQISSSRLARPTTGSSSPSRSSAVSAAWSCPRPPSTRTRSGISRPLRLQPPVAALHDLGHAPEVVRLEQVLRGDVEEPVVRLLRLAVLEDHHATRRCRCPACARCRRPRSGAGGTARPIARASRSTATASSPPVRRKRTRWRSRAFVLGHAARARPPARAAGARTATSRPRRAARYSSTSRPRPGDRDRQVDLGGQERVGVVELGQERLEKRRRVELLRLLEEEVAPVLEHAAPHDEDADRHVLTGLEEAEDVHVLALQRLDDLALGDVPHGPERVAVRRGHLEVLGVRSRLHLLR